MFPERLRALRRGKGITLKQLARALNKNLAKGESKNTESQIGNWERGERNPNYLEVKKLADYFDVSMDYLVGRYNSDQLDLAKAMITSSKLTYNDTPLDNNDKYEILQLISGYLHARGRRSTADLLHIDHQESLDLFHDNHQS
ncbi:helix-turn-helix domain-containing protein [Oenococcus alcoholitolerans]|uniref:XRE family transcriptional regulator n=1 Tax=Oenococcus alcoholitolerans TaxID=931074 RepID=A0ABR4XQH5_9LACO|nr:XRE family transcriptional regulator [Oenococcus alcoholitolerans]